jgi:hypothetical protein
LALFRIKENLMQITPIKLESPFGWFETHYLPTPWERRFPAEHPDSYLQCKLEGRRIDARDGKFWAYLPFLGIYIGVQRIIAGIEEYEHCEKCHLHLLSRQSIQWIVRGVLECIPLLGGVISLVIDLVATLFRSFASETSDAILSDQSACGFCHACDYCDGSDQSRLPIWAPFRGKIGEPLTTAQQNALQTVRARNSSEEVQSGLRNKMVLAPDWSIEVTPLSAQQKAAILSFSGC